MPCRARRSFVLTSKLASPALGEEADPEATRPFAPPRRFRRPT